MRHRATILLLALACACGGDGDRRRVTIRIVHAVTDGEAVDIWIAGRNSRLFENLAFATATGYVTLEPGTYVFQARLAGDPRSVPPVAAGEVDLTGGGGKTFTVVLGGLVAATQDPPLDPPDPDALRIDAYEHGFTSGSIEDTLVRLVHNAAGEPTFNVLLNDDDPLAENNDTFLYEGLAPYTASDAAGIRVDTGEKEQVVVIDNVTGLDLTSFTTAELPARGEFFVIFLGSLQVSPREPAAFRYLVVDQFGGSELREQNPRIYFLNSVADSVSVDVSYRVLDPQGAPTGSYFGLETQIFYRDLGGDAGSSVQLPPGGYEMTVYPTGTMTPLGSELSGELVAGNQYLFVIGGRVDGTWPFRFVKAADEFDRSSFGTGTENRWRVLHAAPDLTAVFLGRVVNNEFTPLAQFPDSLSYGDVTAPEGVDMGIDPFDLVIARQNQVDQYGIWEIVPVPDYFEFVVLMGSIEVPDVFPQLSFIDTTTQPWTLSEQFPVGTPLPDPEPAAATTK